MPFNSTPLIEQPVVAEPTETQILRRALTLLERGWTKKCWARDKRGREVAFESEAAAAFCAIGAIWRAAHELGQAGPLSPRLAYLLARTMQQDIVSFNDAQKSKEPVLQAFRDAITLSLSGSI